MQCMGDGKIYLTLCHKQMDIIGWFIKLSVTRILEIPSALIQKHIRYSELRHIHDLDALLANDTDYCIILYEEN